MNFYLGATAQLFGLKKSLSKVKGRSPGSGLGLQKLKQFADIVWRF